MLFTTYIVSNRKFTDVSGLPEAYHISLIDCNFLSYGVGRLLEIDTFKRLITSKNSGCNHFSLNRVDWYVTISLVYVTTLEEPLTSIGIPLLLNTKCFGKSQFISIGSSGNTEGLQENFGAKSCFVCKKRILVKESLINIRELIVLLWKALKAIIINLNKGLADKAYYGNQSYKVIKDVFQNTVACVAI